MSGWQVWEKIYNKREKEEHTVTMIHKGCEKKTINPHPLQSDHVEGSVANCKNRTAR